MYKTAIEYYQQPVKRSVNYSRYKGPVVHTKERYVPPVPVVDNHTATSSQSDTHMKWQTKHHVNTMDPKVWGPSFWFTLHNGAARYPIAAAPVAKDRMKGYIIGIPGMLPCAVCQTHATNHIENNRDNLDDICSGREKLFKFFVNFHNIVNKRYNKPVVSVEEAYKMYNGGIRVSTMTYA
jgi:hypothetical protein